MLGDHFSPIVASLAPLYWIYGAPRTLLAAQAVLYALFNFHESAFAPPLMALVLERLQAGRARGALLALGALLLVKEDMGLFAAGVGVYLLVNSRRPVISRQRLVAAGVIAGGLCYTWIATRIFVPAFGGSPANYWAYPQFGDSIGQAVVHVITHPVSSLQVLVTPSIKVTTVLWLFGALGFLPTARAPGACRSSSPASLARRCSPAPASWRH